MYGPMPAGHWTGPNAHARGEYGPLQRGRTYRVQRSFVDYDKDAHAVGETWTFLGYAANPYEDGISLFVSMNGGEWHIRMQDRDWEQGPILAALAEYVVEVAP